jgi:hypothetical protein
MKWQILFWKYVCVFHLCKVFGSIKISYPFMWQKPFTEDPASEGSNILVWFGSLCVLPSPWMYCEAHLGTVGVPFYENWRGRGACGYSGYVCFIINRSPSIFFLVKYLKCRSALRANKCKKENIEGVRFASKIICLLSDVFASLRK